MSFKYVASGSGEGNRIKDIIRVANADIRNILCIQNGSNVFMKESSIVNLAEENQISNIDFFCKFIMESKLSEDLNTYLGEGNHNYALIRDTMTPGLVVESYHPEIGEDLIVAKFDLLEAYLQMEQEFKKPEDLPEGEEPIDEYGLERNSMGDSFFGIPIGKVREMVNIITIRLLGFFRADKYTNKKQIDDRIALCKNAIKDCDTEIARVDRNDPSKMYTAQEIMKSLVRLGLKSAISIAGSGIVGGVIGGMINATLQSNVITELLRSSICIYNASNYKTSLQRYKKNLEHTLEYLQMKSDKDYNRRKDLREKSREKRLQMQNASAIISESSINDLNYKNT